MDIQVGSDGKIQLSNGRLIMIRDRATLVAQRLSINLRTYLGEWFLDTNLGIDWFADVLLKNVTRKTVDAIIQSAIKKDMYVESIETFSSNIVNRNYICTFTVNIVDLEFAVELKYLANENNLIVTDQNGNLITIEV